MRFRSNRRAAPGVAVRIRTAVGLLCTVSAAALAGAAVADDDTNTAASPVGEVVVTAPREEVQARAAQLNAPNVVRIQPADTILEYPDFNAAESLGRMPDVSLSSDTAEGRFVQIRGIDANLDGATYGGIPLLNTNPGGTAAGGGGRAVEFDTIPTGAIDGIIVTLTGLPDHEAEGLGGSIELSPRTAAHIDKPFVDATLGGGYEPLHQHGGPYEGEIAIGARFGFGDHGLIVGAGDDQAPRAGFFSNPTPFSFVITASLKEDRRAIDDLEESYVDDGIAQSNAIHQYDLRRYDYHRRRFGYGGEFDFTPNDEHQYYVRADVAGYIESVHKNFLLFRNLDSDENTDPAAGPLGIPVDPNNPRGFLTHGTPTITLTDEEETHRNQVYVIGGRDQFGDVAVDYHGAYSRATFVVSRNIGTRFGGPSVPITYDNVSTPNFPLFTFPTGFNVDDPTQYTLTTVGNDQEFDTDYEWSGAGNASFPLHLFGADDKLKVGAEFRFRTKTATEIDDNFGDANGDLPAINLATVSFAPIPYYAGHYSNGPQVNLHAIRALISNGTIPQQAPTFNQGSFIDDNENIYAGYGEYLGQWGRVGLLVGVRVEATDATYGAFVFDANGNATFDNRPVGYVNAFPTVQLKYTFSPTLIARATYSTGISRPGFVQNTAAASVDLTTIPGTALVTRGNPNLQPTYGDNFDVDVEDYLPEGGILEVGFFDKEFTNYIASRIVRNVPDPLVTDPTLSDVVTTFLNIPTAYARGVDAAYHQKFIFLPEPWDGAGIEANVTYVNSEFVEYDAATSATGKTERGLLPGTSQLTWNLAGFYDAYGVNLRLAAQYVSHSLFGLGGDKSLDTIQDDRLTLDFTSAYHINKQWSVYFNVKNLLNTPLRYYEGAPSRPIQREFYDETYEAGVRMHL
ncbi:MAG TPA: TonB-dependent receptor [Caulobacteraceae bacterium]|nr:TonB-dependent receptor [Caulobacteraceae bacterium]